MCSQCIDRRFAAIAAGLEEHDLSERYETDVLLDPLEGEGLQQAESHVRFGQKLAAIDSSDFVEEYPSILQALPYMTGGSARAAQELWLLHRRLGIETVRVLEIMLARHAGRLAKGSMPRSSLLVLASGTR